MRDETPSRQPSSSFAPAHLDEKQLAEHDARPLPVERYGIESSVAGVVNATFRWWLADLKRLMGIGLIPVALLFFAGLGFTLAVVGAVAAMPEDASPYGWGAASWIAGGGAFFLMLMLAGVAYAAAAAGSVVAIEEVARDEPALSFWQCFVHGLAAMKRLLGFVVIAAVLYAVAGGALVAVVAVGQQLGETVGALVQLAGTGVFTLVLGYVLLRLGPFIAVVALEDRGVVDSIGRTWALTRAREGLLLGSALCVGVIAGVISTLLSALGAIPFVGLPFLFLLFTAVPPIAHAYVFALYAACLETERA